MDVNSMKLTLAGVQRYASTTETMLESAVAPSECDKLTIGSQAQDDDRKEHLHATKAEDDSRSDHCGKR